MPEPSRIARLRITLDDTEPTIWRTVEVPLTASLKLLHEVIQAAMPFEDHHLFEFRKGKVRYAIPDPEWPGAQGVVAVGNTAWMRALEALVSSSIKLHNPQSSS